MIEVVPLFDRPEFIPVVAQWNWAEWRELLPCVSCAAFADELRAHTRRDGVPITFLALDGGVPVGTVSLIADDLEMRPELTPWLASLYVVPARRASGLGTMLAQHAVEAARGFGIDLLYLYTPGQEAFYRRLGWEFLEAAHFCGRAITIMRQRLAREHFREMRPPAQ